MNTDVDRNGLLEEYKRHDWVNVSKGNWSYLSCTDFVSCYTADLTVEGKNPFDHPVQVCIGEKSELWFLKSELDAFGERIGHINTQEKIDALIANVEKTGTEALSFIRHAHAQDFDALSYRRLWEKIREYYRYHLIVKYLGEYLSEEDLKKYTETLKNARVRYGEPIFDESEKLAKQIITIVAEKSGIDGDLVAYFTREELSSFFNREALPDVSDLGQRREKSLILGTPEGYTYVTGEEADEIESFLYHVSEHDADTIVGVTAFKGVVTGAARIVQDPKSVGTFDDGDILVTGMTHVDYLPIVKRASAIVTDAGGILSHAAIIARELQKPCVIGTKNATKLIKDGDTIRVDADNGTVTII